ncbi:hypothetical protein RchiOBHm_Chr1g0362471 [Rosa chinensis]|uniref:Uncharacterized protein n=1 Tax=Rosa chinensis TaxID=74649 RepID=A0A2P6SJ70_ROSCH|nr:hypothetical protein RchiOBHm_Chr1g0362471 [Rosa chinensis]
MAMHSYHLRSGHLGYVCEVKLMKKKRDDLDWIQGHEQLLVFVFAILASWLMVILGSRA